MDIKELKSVCKDLNLLYLEDNDDLREAKNVIFTEIFSNVYTAKNGYEGLDIYLNKKVDLIITDINTPAMNGLEMLRKIKNVDNFSKIIVYSAYSELEYISVMKELDIEKFLRKPVAKGKFLEAIHEVLSEEKEVHCLVGRTD